MFHVKHTEINFRKFFPACRAGRFGPPLVAVFVNGAPYSAKIDFQCETWEPLCGSPFLFEKS